MPSKPIAKTQIDNCDIRLDNYEGNLICLIGHGDYCSSLSVAEDFGTLKGPDGSVYEIDQQSCRKIRAWAESFGY